MKRDEALIQAKYETKKAMSALVRVAKQIRKLAELVIKASETQDA